MTPYECRREARDLVGGRPLAVRTVSAFSEDFKPCGTDARSGPDAFPPQRRTQRIELARLGPRIARAVDEQRRHARRGQTPAIEILVWRGSLVRDPPPRDPVRPDQIAPPLAMLAREHRGDTIAEQIGAGHHRVEELAGRRLAPEKMGRLGDDAAEAFRRRNRHEQRDHRTVAVAPEHGTLEVERRDHRKGLRGGTLVEIDLLPLEPSRGTVSGAIRNHQAMVRRERGDLPVERVNLIAPAAVQNDDRPTGANLTIVNANRRHARREERCG